ncbi:MAG: hypothetical protein SPI21_02920 [Hungatella hathewayi]|uniref:hypothetical protein n=1 Tax=Hungatella TaxID=1649459 RepID=UPI0011073CD7|nr:MULTISPECIES: hypothetical protein [Hungatella]MCI7380741.1 hypothetical protein [Hungatella sp.]MDY6235735.1 hypothetical protein [Hungatella hathewayi]
MKREVYSVKCPSHIQFGDPMYFERFDEEKLSRLVGDYKPSKDFEARVVLEENGIEDSKMVLYLARYGLIDTYMKGYMYETQKQKGKLIGVDTAAYLLNIDERTDVIDTGGDGYWGDCQEFYHIHKGKEFLDAVIITVIMPEFENFASMKGRLQYFFKDISPISDQEECSGQQMK